MRVRCECPTIHRGIAGSITHTQSLTIGTDGTMKGDRVRATLPAKGAIYRGKHISISKFRNGKIATYHDYLDPRTFQIVVDASAESKTAAQ
jgi:ketosteroid isomerase-like protein